MSDYITDDNLLLIFKYLPVKSLLQFRSVCKGWKQLIDSPAFVLDHLSVQTPTFIVQDGRGRRFFVLDPHQSRHSFKSLYKPISGVDLYLFGTLHGIACIFDRFTLFLWNPSIHKMLSIHPPKGSFLDIYVAGKLRVTHGFWISPSTKEFKIMFLQRRPDVKCFLYSSVRGDWGVISIPAKVENWKSCREGPPAMVGDVAHWGGCLDKYADFYHLHDWDHDHQIKAILCFDFVQECFEIIELCKQDVYSKNELDSPYYSCYAAPFRWKDTLSIVCWDREEMPNSCKIYLRKDDLWVGMISFKVCSDLRHVFWAMEDLDKWKKRGKGKRKREEAPQENVRILATARTGCEDRTSELVLEGTRSGEKTVKKGIEYQTDIIMVYDFVESLLFP